MIRHLLACCIIVALDGVVLAGDFTLVPGQNRDFTIMNIHDSWYSNDPGNDLPWPTSREANSENIHAHVLLEANPGQAGMAHAKVGLKVDLQMGQYDWEKIKLWPIRVSIDYSYSIFASWLLYTGSGNAWIIAPDGAVSDRIGYEIGEVGARSDRISYQWDTTLEGLQTERGGMIVCYAVCQAHASEYYSSSNYASADVTIINIRIEFITPSCTEILNNTVHASLVSGGKGLWAMFQPNFNQTLQQAALACGYDYFNWLQWVTYDDDPMRPPVRGVQPNVPYIDPPYGGYDYMAWCGGADSNPGYWNENGIGCSGYQLTKFSFSNYLEFRDYPTVSAAPAKVRFKTALIGVKNGGRPAVIGNWIRWECMAGGLKSVRQNLDESLIISPGVTLEGIMPIAELEPADIAFLTENGIDVDPYPCGYPPAGDVNGDCMVGIVDLNLLAQNWLSSNSIIDTNADSTINIADLAVVAENWLIDCNISDGHPSCPIQ